MRASENPNVDWPVWLAINTALQRYADAIDRGDVAGILALFWPDAVWDYAPGVTRQGHEAIAAFFAERFSVFAQTSHHVGAPVVRPLEAGGFESVAYLLSVHVLKDGTSYTGYGRYIDEFRCNGEGDYLIGRRQVVGHVTQGASRRVHQLARLVS